jgi:epoxyqueuosine reductase
MGLTAWAGGHGAAIGWGDISVLLDALADLAGRCSAGEFDGRFYRERLVPVSSPLDNTTYDPRAVIVLAVPRPAHRVTFTLDAGPFHTLLPPTYVEYDRVRETLLLELPSVFPGEDHVFEILRGPLKAVAARLGLIRYGLNNIAYAPSVGSYHQLVGFITNVEIEEESPCEAGEPRVMAECEDCGICRELCPTGAIPKDRFLLCAERCLTLHSEAPGPWPLWLPPAAHHCLIGCLECQQACPQNPSPLAVESTGVFFTLEETRVIADDGLAGAHCEAPEEVISSVREKIERLGLGEDERVLGRNLRSLIGAQNREWSGVEGER